MSATLFNVGEKKWRVKKKIIFVMETSIGENIDVITPPESILYEPRTFRGEKVVYDHSASYMWPAPPAAPMCRSGYEELDIPEMSSSEIGRICVMSNPTSMRQKIEIDAIKQCLSSGAPDSSKCKATRVIMSEAPSHQEMRSAIRCLKINDCTTFQTT